MRMGIALVLLALGGCHTQEARLKADEAVDIRPATVDASIAAIAAPAVDAGGGGAVASDVNADASPKSAPPIAQKEEAGAPTRKVMPPGMRGSDVPCKTDDDCWSSGAEPIARPKRLRGKKFKPCVDGEHAPMCGGDGTCVTMGYRC